MVRGARPEGTGPVVVISSGTTTIVQYGLLRNAGFLRSSLADCSPLAGTLRSSTTTRTQGWMEQRTQAPHASGGQPKKQREVWWQRSCSPYGRPRANVVLFSTTSSRGNLRTAVTGIYLLLKPNWKCLSSFLLRGRPAAKTATATVLKLASWVLNPSTSVLGV